MSQVLDIPLATEKQVKFLNTLLQEKNLAGTPYEGHSVAPDGLNVRQASEAIDFLLGHPGKKQPNKEALPGYYKYEGGLYEVCQSKQGHNYAKKLWLKQDKATWEFAPGAMKNFQQWEEANLADMKALGMEYGICMVCGRLLTNEESIAAGIGPVCANRF